MGTKGEPQQLLLTDKAAWRHWLDSNEYSSDGVRLVLAKKGTLHPTALSYSEALDEALCSGWIDGRRNGLDEATFLQHFLPRRARSNWSQRNVGIAQRLILEKRMRPRGEAEMLAAKADGRWDRAYPGQSTATAPDDLLRALSVRPEVLDAFDSMSKSERYPLILDVISAPDGARQARIDRVVLRLSRS